MWQLLHFATPKICPDGWSQVELIGSFNCFLYKILSKQKQALTMSVWVCRGVFNDFRNQKTNIQIPTEGALNTHSDITLGKLSH